MASVNTAELELVAAGVVAGRTDIAIAQDLGMSPRTYYRRKSMPATQQLIEEARRDAARRIREGVVAGALVGLERLRHVVGDPNSPDGAAVNASKYLIDLAIGPGGLPGLAEPVGHGETCVTCGTHGPDELGRSLVVQRIREHLDEVREGLLSASVVELVSAESSTLSR